MARYANGKVPASLLVWDRHGNPWLPGTYRKWVVFQREVYERTKARFGKGVWLYVSPKANGAFNTYRDVPGQFALRAHWKSLGKPLMVSVPGRSSHGANWTGQTNGRYGLLRYVQNIDAGAFDVANWGDVPWDIFEAAATKAGLLVNIVVPEERWHVVDLTPYDVPATAGGEGTSLKQEEDEMSAEAEKKIKAIHDAIFNGGKSMKDGGASISDSLARIAANVGPIIRGGKPVSLRQEIADTKTKVYALEAALKALATAKGADPAALSAVVENAVKDAMRDVTFTADIG